MPQRVLGPMLGGTGARAALVEAVRAARAAAAPPEFALAEGEEERWTVERPLQALRTIWAAGQ
eukprot:10349051-Alexandrium_andersonii.AAC.1